MALFAGALRADGTPVPEIARKLIIKTGKNAGSHPSVATVYRALQPRHTEKVPPDFDESHERPVSAENLAAHSRSGGGTTFA